MTDTIADLLVRLNNGTLAGKESVHVPYSRTKGAILAVLKEEGYIGEYKEEKDSGDFVVGLEGVKKSFIKMSRVSTPGRRVYIKSREIRRPKGYGTVVISTPKGILSGFKARKVGVGGEVICEVY